eukprot:gene7251-8429_t
MFRPTTSASLLTSSSSLRQSPSMQSIFNRPKTSKIINDVIHGHMDVPTYILDFVDSSQFQRLRDLKQLGTTSFVFPCASHHRFEHSLGVSHLAGKFIDRIKQTQPELRITEEEQKFVRIAGLCHDLGHGPFSHAFESWANSTGKHFHHEDMSIKMLNSLIDDKGLDYDTNDIKTIGSLISGNKPPGDDRQFLYDIVANQRNSIDVDKFDYLARDSYYLGRAIVCDFTSLHKLVYTHKVGKSIEYMIADAFSSADPFLKISDMLDDPAEFINLTDSIIQRIEYSKEPELKESRRIIKDIRNRNLYKFVDEVILGPENVFPDITAEDIAKEGRNLFASEIIVQNLTLNYAFKDKDPVEHTNFYTRFDNSTKVQILKEHASHLIPNQFQEKRVRVFSKIKEKSVQ